MNKDKMLLYELSQPIHNSADLSSHCRTFQFNILRKVELRRKSLIILVEYKTDVAVTIYSSHAIHTDHSPKTSSLKREQHEDICSASAKLQSNLSESHVSHTRDMM